MRGEINTKTMTAFVPLFTGKTRLHRTVRGAGCGRRDARVRVLMQESGQARRMAEAERGGGDEDAVMGRAFGEEGAEDVGGIEVEEGEQEEGTQNLGETADSEPLFTSSLMTAMRDYFGDDGREVQDYMKRPRNEQSKPMFRVVIAGNGDDDIELAKRLQESKLMRGLYYVGDNEDRLYPTEDGDIKSVEQARKEGLVMTDMAKYADVANENEGFSGDHVVSFAIWCVADAVFMGEERAGDCGDKVESALADAGITMFAPDVGKAIVRGELDVMECLLPLISDEEDGAESLIE